MLTKLSIRRPVSMIMLLLIIMLAGIVALLGIKLDLLPSMDIPVSVVYSTYTGAGPEEVESLITEPLEESLATVPHIDKLSSVSSDGMALVILQFADGTDLDMAAIDVREKVDLVKSSLPDGATAPVVIKIDPSMMSQLEIGVSGDMDLTELQTLLEEKVEPRLKRIEGVASVDFSGGPEREIEVTVYPERLAGYNLTQAQLGQLLAAENMNYPLGQIKQGESKLLIRSVGEFSTLEELKSLPITTPTGAVIHLSDVADVKEVDKDLSSYAVVDEKQSVIMTVQKQSDANTVEVADAVRKELKALSEDYPDVNFQVLIDTSDYIKSSVNNVFETLFSACLLSILVVFLFLKQVRGSLIIGVSIPVSVITTFALMYVSGITFNIISLGGLIIGMGDVVDNSIVVLESVSRHFKEGKDARTSALDGTKEVAASIVAGTLSTCCVYIPLLFIQGTVGQIFRDLSLTVCFSLTASLLVAITFMPMACAKLLKREASKKAVAEKKNVITRLLGGWEYLIDHIQDTYRVALTWALAKRGKAALITLCVFVATLISIPLAGMEFIPNMDQGMVTINMEMPAGVVLDETVSQIDVVMAAIKDIPEIKETYAIVGGSGLSTVMTGSGAATVYANLSDKEDRKRSAETIGDEIRQKVKHIAGAKITVSASSSSMGAYSNTGISMRITGAETDELRRIGNDVVQLVGKVEGTRDVVSSAGKSIPEANVRVNRDKASAYGITAAQVSAAISGAISGSVATEFKISGGELDIRIRQDAQSLEYINDLQNIRVATPYGTSVPLSSLADIAVEDGPVSISRYNQQRYITVDAPIYGRDLNSVQTEITEKMNTYKMPSGYIWEYTGIVEQMTDSFINLLLVLAVAALLVYMVMVAQFQKYLNPFIIMFSVPIALTGGLSGLYITGHSIDITSLVGLIMLVGMAVKNAIMLIDYTEQLRDEGLSCREGAAGIGLHTYSPHPDDHAYDGSRPAAHGDCHIKRYRDDKTHGHCY